MEDCGSLAASASDRLREASSSAACHSRRGQRCVGVLHLGRELLSVPRVLGVPHPLQFVQRPGAAAFDLAETTPAGLVPLEDAAVALRVGPCVLAGDLCVDAADLGVEIDVGVE